MKTIEKKYYHIKNTPEFKDVEFGSDNAIQTSLVYDDGSYSHNRGYYIKASVVGRGDKSGASYITEQMLVSNSTALRYTTVLIKEVGRQSKKAEADALEVYLAKERGVANSLGYELEEVA